MNKSKLLAMNNIGIVVESLDNAIAFFTELGCGSRDALLSKASGQGA
jgi:hypothetical protein